MKYKFSHKKKYIWRCDMVIGHVYNVEVDRMCLLFEDGGIKEIAEWSLCDCKLGSDWALAKKKDMESKAGQPIVVNRDLNAN